MKVLTNLGIQPTRNSMGHKLNFIFRGEDENWWQAYKEGENDMRYENHKYSSE